MQVVITPCTADGISLDEKHYTNDPGQLLNKPFNFKVSLAFGPNIFLICNIT